MIFGNIFTKKFRIVNYFLKHYDSLLEEDGNCSTPSPTLVSLTLL